MRANGRLIHLVALAMAAIVVLPTPSALGQSKEILLPLTFNEVAKGDVPAILRGDDAFLKPGDLERFGLTGTMWDRVRTFSRLIAGSRVMVGDTEFVSLKSLSPYVTFNVDPAALTLSVTAAPQLLAATNMNLQLGPPPNIIYTKGLNAFLNYSATEQPGHHPTLFAENGVSIYGNLLLNSVSRTTSGDVVRLLSNYTIDERQHLRRWTVGDANVITDAIGGSGLIGGVTVQRNFNLDPYFVRFPPVDFKGTALTPSRVEVFVNGAMVSQQEVPPGPFELRNIPVASGAGNAQVVVRDVFGHEQTATQPFYYSTAILEKGLSEFTYSAGFVRNNFGSKSWDYGDPALLAFHRVGVTDSITAGGRLEASKEMVSGGPLGSWRSRLGEFDVAIAGSSDHGKSGEAGSLGYRYLARRMSVGGFARAMSDDYTTVSLNRTADRPLLDASAFVTLLGGRASYTLLWSKARYRDSIDTESVSLLGNLPVARHASLFLSVGSVDQGKGRKPQVFAGLSYFFGGATSASLTVDHSDGKTQTLAEISKTLPVGTGYGYRLQTAMQNGGDHNGSGAIQYQTDFGRYEVDFDPYHSSTRPTFSLSGGVVYEAGALKAARPVEDSFALVRVPGVPGVRVYSENNLVGRTDGNGDVLIPNLLPYYGNRLRIDDRDVPLNYEVQDIEKTIAPPYRGGAFVPFAVKQIRTVAGSLRIHAGKADVVPAFGQLTISGGGQKYESPLGREGEFYFENLPSGTYDATVEYRDGTCTFRIDIPAGADSIVKLGQRTCTSEAPKS